MKKVFALTLSILMILTAFTACGGGEDTDTTKENKAESSEETDSNKENDSETTTKAPEEADKEEEEELVTAWVVTKWNDTEFIYDDNWCRIGAKYLDAEGNVIEEYYEDLVYDENGNFIGEDSTGGICQRHEYNEYSDCKKSLVYNDYSDKVDTTIYEYEYDSDGKMLYKLEWECYDYEMYQNELSVTQYIYNEKGELETEICTSKWDRTKTEYVYDNGLLIKKTDYKAVTPADEFSFYSSVSYTYDSKNRILSETTAYADGNTYTSEHTYVDHEDGTYDVSDEWQTRTYDEHGNLISMKYNNNDYMFAEITYTPVQVTPIRAKAIERDYHSISLYRLQK